MADGQVSDDLLQESYRLVLNGFSRKRLREILAGCLPENVNEY